MPSLRGRPVLVREAEEVTDFHHQNIELVNFHKMQLKTLIFAKWRKRIFVYITKANSVSSSITNLNFKNERRKSGQPAS